MSEEKNMIVAMILSVLFAGLGLIYAEDVKKGVILVAIGTIFNILHYKINPLLGIIVFIAWIYGLYATYQKIQVINGN